MLEVKSIIDDACICEETSDYFELEVVRYCFFLLMLNMFYFLNLHLTMTRWDIANDYAVENSF